MRVAFEREDHDAVLQTLAERVSPRVLHAPARLATAARQVEDYLAGRRTGFDLPLDLSLATGFRRSVLEHLRQIGYGRTESLHAGGDGGRQPAGGAGRRVGVRDQPGPRRRAVPPGAALGRIARRVRRGLAAKQALLGLEAAA